MKEKQNEGIQRKYWVNRDPEYELKKKRIEELRYSTPP